MDLVLDWFWSTLGERPTYFFFLYVLIVSRRLPSIRCITPASDSIMRRLIGAPVQERNRVLFVSYARLARLGVWICRVGVWENTVVL